MPSNEHYNAMLPFPEQFLTILSIESADGVQEKHAMPSLTASKSSA